jgi:hypothetical protein
MKASGLSKALSMFTSISYLKYKQRGIETLKAHQDEIAKLTEDEAPAAEEEG